MSECSSSKINFLIIKNIKNCNDYNVQHRNILFKTHILLQNENNKARATTEGTRSVDALRTVKTFLNRLPLPSSQCVTSVSDL